MLKKSLFSPSRATSGQEPGWTVRRFLELLKTWADFDPHRPLSPAGIKPHVDAVNALLGLPEGHPARFVHTLGEVPVTPVPFAFQGDRGKVRLAVLGLNPRCGVPLTVDEKTMTRELAPESYARFYTSARYLPYALSGPYYRNLATLLLSLDQGRLLKFSDFHRSGNHRDAAAAFAALVAAQGVLEMRLVPFYSRAWRPAGTAGLAKLRLHPRYGRYYDQLVDMLEDFLPPGGWIVANGRDPSLLLPQLLAQRAPLVPAGPADPDLPYAFHRWRDRRVVLLKQFWRSRGGRLNTNQNLARLFADVYRTFQL